MSQAIAEIEHKQWFYDLPLRDLRGVKGVRCYRAMPCAPITTEVLRAAVAQDIGRKMSSVRMRAGQRLPDLVRVNRASEKAVGLDTG